MNMADDPFLWLEDVQGEAALTWVRERNAESQKVLMARPEYAPTRERLPTSAPLIRACCRCL